VSLTEEPGHGLDLNLEDLFCYLQGGYYFNHILTNTVHGAKAVAIINDLLDTNPEYRSVLTALVCYPIQKWASACRRKINVTSFGAAQILSEFTAISRQVKELTDVSARLELKEYKRCLEDSESCLRFIEVAANDLLDNPLVGPRGYSVIEAVHLSVGREENLSLYRFDHHYRNALKVMCDKYCRQFNRLMDSSLRRLQSLSQADWSVFHNTALLAEVYRALFWKYRDVSRRDLNESSATSIQNSLQLIGMVDKAIEGLKTYPGACSDLHVVGKYHFQGKDDKWIRERTGVTYTSSKKLSSMRRLSMSAISFVLWGYTIPEIVDILI